MKGLKLSLVIMAAALVTIGLSGMAYAFHEGGVAHCDGCHTMHNSLGGAAVTKAAQYTGYSFLLKGSDQSSTCLNCHSGGTLSGYHVATAPIPGAGVAPANYTPGGDFAYLQKTYNWTTSRGGAGTSKAERHGHNIIASDFSYTQDGTLLKAPGGTYPNTALGCQSCHDPHGKTRIIDAAGTMATPTSGARVLPIGSSGSYGAMPTADEAVGVYRLLGGAGYAPVSYNSLPFASNPPVAVAPSTYNQIENATTKMVRVAYGSGMSEWCANCHKSIHNDSLASALIHPASNAARLTATIAANYNAYLKSGDLTNAPGTSYLTLVPYEEGISDRAALALHAKSDGSGTAGPSTGTENVMCLTCHKAHATAWDSMTRWNAKATFLTVGGSYPGSDSTVPEGALGENAMGKTVAEWQAGMNGYDKSNFAYVQRSLCNKCHVKD